MAVIFIERQLKSHGRPEPLTAVLRKAHGQRHSVRYGKIHAAHIVRQQVRVPPHHFQRAVPILLPQPDSQHRRELIPGEEFHETPQPHVLTEHRADLHGLFRGDAANHLEPLRLRFQNVQRIKAEALHDAPRRGGTDALADAGGQVR